MTKQIEVVAVQFGEKIYFDKESIKLYIKNEYMPKLIRREVFQLMEAFDIWTDRGYSELPTLYRFTEEQWKQVREWGIAHG